MNGDRKFLRSVHEISLINVYEVFILLFIKISINETKWFQHRTKKIKNKLNDHIVTIYSVVFIFLFIAIILFLFSVFPFNHLSMFIIVIIITHRKNIYIESIDTEREKKNNGILITMLRLTISNGTNKQNLF